MALLGLFLLAACAALALWSLMQTRRALARSSAELGKAKAEHDAVLAETVASRGDVQSLKQQLREERDALKALKKKVYEAKKGVRLAPEVTADDEVSAPAADARSGRLDESELKQQLLQLDRSWREAESRSSEVSAAKDAAEEKSRMLAEKLGAVEATLERVKDDEQREVLALRERLLREQQRVGAEAKSILDMRRKVEWHRRIHVVQKSELQLERDKAAHLRQRFLEVCTEIVRLGQKPLSAERQFEVERIQREEAAYQSTQVDEGKDEKAHHTTHARTALVRSDAGVDAVSVGVNEAVTPAHAAMHAARAGVDGVSSMHSAFN